MPYQLLIVEDDPGIIDALTEEFEQAFAGEMKVDHCRFNEALVRVQTVRPDIVILDRHEGLAADAARPIWDYIWDKYFCPVIFYSAYDATGYEPLDHPFHIMNRKGGAALQE